MANYCKKSSLEAIADEIRVRNGDSSSTKYLFPSGFTSTISGLLIPTQRGAPSKELKTNDSSYIIQKGVYTGGSVTVDPIEWLTIVQPSASQQIIKDANNKPLKKVTVGAYNLHPLAVGAWRGSVKNPTSITVSNITYNGSPFKPIGLILICASSDYSSDKSGSINQMWFVDGVVGGHATASNSTSSTNRSAIITSANVSFSNGSFSVSNVSCRDTAKTQTAHFYQQYTNASSNANYLYYVWG